MVRRLAAILAADVVAYSRLMERDEAGTLALLRARRQEVLMPLVTQHGGRVFKVMGDGVLVEFASISNAVECAVALQRGFGERNASILAAQRIELRIGIHLGDVIVEGSDLYGDSVNLAARLEALAEPGGVCLSGDAYRQVRSKLQFDFQDLGEHKLKNIAEPVRAYRIQLDDNEASVAPAAGDTVPSPPHKPSIAVLPFANMSGDAEQDYFSEGITEDIITNVSRNRAFFVISRSTSFTYKGSAVDVGKVARELGVRYVLEGSVRRSGSRVRITAQLIDAAAGHHLWAERYDRELADVFAVQDEIATNIIGAIAPGIMSAEIQHAQRKHPSQLDAWDRIMRAHWHIRRFTRDDMAEARRLLGEAILLDPRNSTALSDLAYASHFESVFGWGGGRVADGRARSGDAARKAVAADDSDASAHTALAIHELFTGHHEEARRRLRRALDLDPNSAFARGNLGVAYAFGGDCDGALPHLEEAIRLSPRDPLLIIWHLCKGWAALTAGRYEEATEFTAQAAEANPEFPDIYAVLAAANGQLGRADAARAALDELARRMPNLTLGDERLDRPFARAADRESFLEGLRKAGMPA